MKKETFELLDRLYHVYSPSYGENKMRKFIKKYVRSIGVNNIYGDNGNLYITKGDADEYPCVVAHMDQVQKKHTKDFATMVVGDIIFGYTSKQGETRDDVLTRMISEGDDMREGLGADDKNGILVALECLKKYDNIKVAFFMGEEVGCVGSEKADMKFFSDVRFVIQCDRKNGGDFIYSVYGRMCSDEFMNDTNMASFGYKPTEGASTDSATLSANGVGVSCCNMSCGYYKPHTDYEYTRLSELDNCINFVFKIIDNCQKKYPYETKGYYDDFWGYFGHGSSTDLYADLYSDQYDYDYNIMDEAITDNPGFSFEDIHNLYKDEFFSTSEVELRSIYDDLMFYYGDKDETLEKIEKTA